VTAKASGLPNVVGTTASDGQRHREITSTLPKSPGFGRHPASMLVTSVAYPAFDGTPAYTDTYNYIVGGDPLVTSVTKSVTGGPTTTLTTTVDLLGRVVSYTDANGNTTATTYDQPGRVTSSCFTPSGGSSCASTMSTSYDSHGRVANDSYNGTVADTPAYDSDSDLTGASYGNGTSLSYTYDPEGRTTAESFKQSGGTGLFSDTDVLSQAGDVQSDTEDGPGGGQFGAATYTYDTAGRLVTANGDGQDLSYTYASSGGCGTLNGAGLNSDRTSMSDTNLSTNAETNTTYCYGNNDQLTSYTATGSGPVTPGYDTTDGNTASLGNESFTYDAQDQVVSITSSTQTITYARDHLRPGRARTRGGA
jgi:YD repeat-containing protein